MIDTHCHLTHARFAADQGEVIGRARAAGVAACLTIGTGIEDALAAHALVAAYPGYVQAAAGLDPFSSHAAGDRFDVAFDALAALHREGKFAAVGEIGLDYHYDLDPRPVQAVRF
jgi:TatD DNase family protein